MLIKKAVSYLNAINNINDKNAPITTTPYLRASKKATQQYFSKDWIHGWQWKIKIGGGAPTDFDIYAKDIDFGMGSIDSDTVSVGAGGIAIPTKGDPSEITMTVKDDRQQTIKQFFQKKLSAIKNKDGTLNLPIDYVFPVEIYLLDEDCNETLFESFNVFVAKIGSANFTRESNNQFFSYPVILQKFSSVGNKRF